MPTRRFVVHAAILAMVSVSALFGRADAHHYTTIDTQHALSARAEEFGVSYAVMSCIAWKESRFYPHALGSQLEEGVFQLHPRGLKPHFLRVGYRDTNSPWEQTHYFARVLRGDWAHEGVNLSHWPTRFGCV